MADAKKDAKDSVDADAAAKAAAAKAKAASKKAKKGLSQSEQLLIMCVSIDASRMRTLPVRVIDRVPSAVRAYHDTLFCRAYPPGQSHAPPPLLNAQAHAPPPLLNAPVCCADYL